MASDIIVRAAKSDPHISATVAISMFSRAVTADQPKNLLMIVGAWEGFLAAEATRVLALAAGDTARDGLTYGTPADGTGRRLALADNVEHVGVLYSRETLAETVAWLDEVFGQSASGYLDARGPWLGLLFTGIVALAWPLSGLLPGIARARPAHPVPRLSLAAACFAPALLTPLILWPFEASFLPVLMADYLALHFAIYGVLLWAAVWWLGGPKPTTPGLRLLLATAAATVFAVFAIGVPLDRYVASFMPHAGRLPVLLALAAGAFLYALADAWLLRRPKAPRWAAAFSKVCFLMSLGIAVALSPRDLFFLLIIAPVIVLFFLIYGLMGGWVTRATGHPSVTGTATGVAFGWALAVTFPLLAG